MLTKKWTALRREDQGLDICEIARPLHCCFQNRWPLQAGHFSRKICGFSENGGQKQGNIKKKQRTIKKLSKDIVPKNNPFFSGRRRPFRGRCHLDTIHDYRSLEGAAMQTLSATIVSSKLMSVDKFGHSGKKLLSEVRPAQSSELGFLQSRSLGRGCDEALFSDKARFFFCEKREGSSVNRGLGKHFYRKGN